MFEGFEYRGWDRGMALMLWEVMYMPLEVPTYWFLYLELGLKSHYDFRLSSTEGDCWHLKVRARRATQVEREWREV